MATSPNRNQLDRSGNGAKDYQPRSEDEIEFSENTGNIYDAISLQLLDLMYALHTKAGKILGKMVVSTCWFKCFNLLVSKQVDFFLVQPRIVIVFIIITILRECVTSGFLDVCHQRKSN